jgi:hypothetical protein
MDSDSIEEKLPRVLPLATLIGRELRGGGSERPLVRFGHSGFAKRGEDYFLVKPDCLRVPGDPSSAFSVFAVRALSYSLSPFFLSRVRSSEEGHVCFLESAAGRCSTGTMACRRRCSARSTCWKT